MAARRCICLNGSFRLNEGDGPHEAIAAAGHCMDEVGLFGIITEDLAHLAHGGIDSMLSIDEDVAAPKALSNFGPGKNITLTRRKKDEQLHRFALELEKSTTAAQLEAGAIEPKIAEFNDRGDHWSAGLARKSISTYPGNARSDFF